MKPKKKKAIERPSTVKNRCDKAWSLIIRNRANSLCEMCGAKEGNRMVTFKSGPRKGKSAMVLVKNHAHHIIRRSVKRFRWDLGNGICLCASCHMTKAHAEIFVDQLAYHSWIKEFWAINRLSTYGGFDHRVDMAREWGVKNIPMSELRQIDISLKLEVK